MDDFLKQTHKGAIHAALGMCRCGAGQTCWWGVATWGGRAPVRGGRALASIRRRALASIGRWWALASIGRWRTLAAVRWRALAVRGWRWACPIHRRWGCSCWGCSRWGWGPGGSGRAGSPCWAGGRAVAAGQLAEVAGDHPRVLALAVGLLQGRQGVRDPAQRAS